MIRVQKDLLSAGIKMQLIDIFIVMLLSFASSARASDNSLENAGTPYSDQKNTSKAQNTDGVGDKPQSKFEKSYEAGGAKNIPDWKKVQHRFEHGHYDHMHKGFQWAEGHMTEIDGWGPDEDGPKVEEPGPKGGKIEMVNTDNRRNFNGENEDSVELDR